MTITLGSYSFDSSDIGTMAGMLVIALGLWMGVRQHRLRWELEEAQKNQKMTEDEVRRRMTWITWRPIGLLALGLALVIAAVATLKK
ncbi:MAG TPA: hypothetical protein VG710_05325 [Opitutus sp.]|nr:hypothetical protein [Opitutus sp.]